MLTRPTTNDVLETVIRFWFLAKDSRSSRAKGGRRDSGARLLVATERHHVADAVNNILLRCADEFSGDRNDLLAN